MKGHIYAGTENFMGSNGTSSTSKSTQNTSGGLDIGAVIKAGGEAAGVIIEAIGTVRDANLRRQFEERLAVLNVAEQNALSEKLLKAQTDNEKRKILAENLTATNVARIQAFSKEGQGTTIALWTIAAVLILGAGVVIYKKSKKK
jgi:uncharacterized protein HemX